uniref:Uncharacterized protein n=1 Tax=Anopheles melas TaxID=34690 RepID=A0A182UI17_9DIPT
MVASCDDGFSLAGGGCFLFRIDNGRFYPDWANVTVGDSSCCCCFDRPSVATALPAVQCNRIVLVYRRRFDSTGQNSNDSTTGGSGGPGNSAGPTGIHGAPGTPNSSSSSSSQGMRPTPSPTGSGSGSRSMSPAVGKLCRGGGGPREEEEDGGI